MIFYFSPAAKRRHPNPRELLLTLKSRKNQLNLGRAALHYLVIILFYIQFKSVTNALTFQQIGANDPKSRRPKHLVMIQEKWFAQKLSPNRVSSK